VEAVATSEIDRSDWPAPVTPAIAVAELLVARESLAAPAVTVSVIVVPDAVPPLTFTVAEKFPVAPAARLAMLQVIVPVPFTAGVEQLHPTGELRDWKVVFAGIGSLNVTVVAAAEP
jgi:hypothetical protein